MSQDSGYNPDPDNHIFMLPMRLAKSRLLQPRSLQFRGKRLIIQSLYAHGSIEILKRERGPHGSYLG